MLTHSLIGGYLTRQLYNSILISCRHVRSFSYKIVLYAWICMALNTFICWINSTRSLYFSIILDSQTDDHIQLLWENSDCPVQLEYEHRGPHFYMERICPKVDAKTRHYGNSKIAYFITNNLIKFIANY